MENNNKAWNSFKEGRWQNIIDVRDFIQKNYIPYEGDDSFLVGATKKTENVWNKCRELLVQENAKGVLDVDTETVSTITSHKPGYIEKENEELARLKKPLKRMPLFVSRVQLTDAVLANAKARDYYWITGCLWPWSDYW